MIITSEHKSFLNNHFSGVQYGEPLKNYSSFRVGGPADAIIFPKSSGQLSLLLSWLKHQQISWIVIGAGSNILFDDYGFRGIVICLTNCSSIEWDGKSIKANAGVSLKFLCLHAIRHSLAGMNFALGIPGTLGGAIRMNAGAQGGEISDILESIDCISTDGNSHHIKKETLKIGYRQMSWEHVAPGAVISGATLLLSQTDPKILRKDAQKKMIQRRKTQPIGCACAGSFFKNPLGHFSAGYLIEQSGLKGFCLGDACVSQKHANFIMNKGHATSKEIKALMQHIQHEVHSKFNIKLIPEVNIIHA
jgi:UDP-N-acetylmuramate dehydrogenase